MSEPRRLRTGRERASAQPPGKQRGLRRARGVGQGLGAHHFARVFSAQRRRRRAAAWVLVRCWPGAFAFGGVGMGGMDCGN